MKSMIQKVTISAADDFHLHLRDGKVLSSVVQATAERFRRAIIMPNLKPPVVNTKQALAYRERIMAALASTSAASSSFNPMMTLYLTDSTPPDEIKKAKASGKVFACKLYPAGATTNSDSGVTCVSKIKATLQAMSDVGMPLLVHGEVTDSKIDLFDREAVFIDEILKPLIQDFPDLKVVMEHITTKDAADFVASQGPNLAATITAHHLLYNRNVIFKGGINPHYYCLPVLKRETHRRALVKAALSGSPKFFAGTDSAPHAKHNKEKCCGCAGCYTSFAAAELYCEAFANEGGFEADADSKSDGDSDAYSTARFQAFMSENGARFYGLKTNAEEDPDATLTLVKKEWEVPAEMPLGDDVVVPLRAGEKNEWSLLQE